MVSAAGLLVDWLLLSALYALVAIGFTMIFGVGGVLNLAHGGILTVGAFTAWGVTTHGGHIAIGIVVGTLTAGLFAGVIYLVLAREFMDEPLVILILTLVVAVIVEEVIATFIGTQSVLVRQLVPGTTELLEVSIQLNRITMFAVSWIAIGAVFVFVNHTDAGRAVIATSMSERGAAVVGINADRVQLITWIIAGALAGLGGIFLGMEYLASYSMGRNPLVLSFAIVVLGGLGSIKGSVIAAYLIGFVETTTVHMISPRVTGMAAFIILIIVLLTKPEGLYGREFVE